jgi:sulfatase maturation enzyme AslB (radical SAM superfamily)
VTEYLVEKSIPREKIRFPNGVELDGKPKYCEIMTRYIRLDDGSAENNLLEWGFCCFQNGNRFKCSGDGLDNAYLEFVAARDRMIADLQAGYDCPCTGCPMLKTGTPPPRFGKPDIFFVLGTGLVGANSCNFKCGYCIFKNYIHQPGNQCINYSVIDVLEWLVKQSHFNVEFLGYECGELTVSVLRHQVYDIWKEQKWRGRILTNAGIFSQEIAELFSKEQVGAIISLDAGTKETFAKIKGVDCFGRVLENLKLYAGALKDGERRLNLKYILLDNVNDNEADVTEFIRICAELNARPILTIDYWIGENPFGIRQIEMFKRFKDEADRHGLTCYFRDNSLNIGNMSVVSKIFGADKLLYEEQNCDALND